ncbi:MAG: bifunctional phosphoribosyl-AMP cyclohydrolase/phosphoribosyl-ATP diphosphatase HisIE [Bacteroidetes bacterium]|nr:MAG: bifunctional phosphoribosyl-AMP cyclohydrolase/phosphoribosyl-ATP diphosphatase HisIE [Bacteroidota bacterium]TAE58935.1 MAG: bifunctional phosphoribosyl-AMP cyclohydrolase/phosphoribosyl-ATP diphosphatase HisIE [Bacteroidota bacterium]TAF91443.1 MAG: bifunctional phosphoribosyl-AMP cyclohydrolase/phosphoribosyl-ATP diphosphatase HisIE [Bacteroidota bacterium]
MNFSKYSDGLIPAIVQDAITQKVLMLGFMNQESVDATRQLQKVTFFSRSKNRLWTKGEESGNYLEFVSMQEDCDADTLLVKAIPVGPVCHTGTDTCFAESNTGIGFLTKLESIIEQRKQADASESYVSSLFVKGLNKIAQKVGEEAVEVVIEAKDNNEHLFLNEAADLLFHYLILLRAKETNLQAVVDILQKRHTK